MSEEQEQPIIRFRQRNKKRKQVQFAKTNRVRYFDRNNSTNTIKNKQDTNEDMNIINHNEEDNNTPNINIENNNNFCWSNLNFNVKNITKNSKFNDLDAVLLMAEKNAISKIANHNKNDNDTENETELKYDSTDIDPYYDAKQDDINAKYVYEKYTNQTAIQSDCTLCCANCFVFIAYVSQKDRKCHNKYKCFSVDNCIINKENKVICKECDTDIGYRECINYISDGIDKQNNAQEKVNMELEDNVDDNEKNIWRLISSDFSMLKAPVLNCDVIELVEKQEESVDNDNNVYLYHLTHVLPGLI